MAGEWPVGHDWSFCVKELSTIFPFQLFHHSEAFRTDEDCRDWDWIISVLNRFGFVFGTLYCTLPPFNLPEGKDTIVCFRVMCNFCMCVLPVDSSVHRMPDPRATKRSTSQRNLPESVYRLHRSGYNLSGTSRFGSFSAALMVDAKWNEKLGQPVNNYRYWRYYDTGLA